MEPVGLTWINSAVERTEHALGQMRLAQRISFESLEPDRDITAIDLMLSASDQLRLAANHLSESVNSLRRASEKKGTSGRG